MKKSKMITMFISAVLAVSMTGCGAGNENLDVDTSSVSDNKAAETSAQAEETKADETTATDESTADVTTAETTEADVTTTADESGNAETTTSEAKKDAASMSFKTGLWEGTDAFFYFSDETSGHTLSYELQIGNGFTYEMTDDGNAVFHMVEADDNSAAKVTMTDDSAVILWLDDDKEIRLNYLADYTEDDFNNFYADPLLLDMAKDYYKNSTGTEPESAEISGTNGLYAPISVYADGKVVAEYAVNRITLKGTCIETGEEVILLTSKNKE